MRNNNNYNKFQIHAFKNVKMQAKIFNNYNNAK